MFQLTERTDGEQDPSLRVLGLALVALGVLGLAPALFVGCTSGGRGDDDSTAGDDDTVLDDDDAVPNDDDDTGPADDDSADDDDTSGSQSTGPCNGHIELCDRPFDEVALPATHNSMSNEAAGWVLPNQSFGITRQLNDGIRGLMLDTHYWNDDLYLCHGHCTLGSQLLVDGLTEIREFMQANPREVLVIIFEDGISAADTASAFAATGLEPLVHVQPEGAAWPTLEEMIAAGRTLVVTAESGAPPPLWYYHAWDLYFDTPYQFLSVGDFNCDVNRGQANNDLFLINHWLGPVSLSSNAATANVWSVLSQRAEQCRATHQRIPNLLAVDFYEYGDLFAVVDSLNGLWP